MWAYTCFCKNVIIQPWSCNVISALHRISDLSRRFYLFFSTVCIHELKERLRKLTHTHRHTLAIKQLVWVRFFFFSYLIPVAANGFSSPNNKLESGNGETDLVPPHTQQANLKVCYLSSFISLSPYFFHSLYVHYSALYVFLVFPPRVCDAHRCLVTLQCSAE